MRYEILISRIYEYIKDVGLETHTLQTVHIEAIDCNIIYSS